MVESGAVAGWRGVFHKELRDKSALSPWHAERGPGGILPKPSQNITDSYAVYTLG